MDLGIDEMPNLSMNMISERVMLPTLIQTSMIRYAKIDRNTTHKNFNGRDHANGSSCEVAGTHNAPRRAKGRCANVEIFTNG